MSDNKEKVLEKISKLLKVAEKGSGATEAEVENALHRVEELLKANNLDSSDIKTDEATQQIEVFTEQEMNQNTTLHNWEKFLLHCIADTCLCKMIYGKKCVDYKESTDMIRYGFHKSYKAITVVYFCGRPCDIALAQHFYKYLRGIIIQATKGMTGSTRDDYARGMVCSLSKKLDQFRVNVNALVPVGLDEWIEEKYPIMGTTRGYRHSHTTSAAMVAGFSAGDKVNLNRPIAPTAIGYQG